MGIAKPKREADIDEAMPIGKVVEKSGIVWYNSFIRSVNLPYK